MAGGLSEDAGPSVTITRRLEWGRIPLADAAEDATGGFSVAQIDVKSLLEAPAVPNAALRTAAARFKKAVKDGSLIP